MSAVFTDLRPETLLCHKDSGVVASVREFVIATSRAEAVSFETAAAQVDLRVKAEIYRIVPPETPCEERTCGGCGCTESNACGDGCTRVGPNLCSSCDATDVRVPRSREEILADFDSLLPTSGDEQRGQIAQRIQLEVLLDIRDLLGYSVARTVELSTGINANDLGEALRRSLIVAGPGAIADLSIR